MTLLRLARRFLSQRKGLVATVVVLQLGQILLSLWIPSINAVIIDEGILARDTGRIWSEGTLMLGVAIVQIILQAIAIYLGSKVATELGYELRAHMFGHVQRLSATDQHHFGAPSLITRSTNDVQQVQMVILMSFTFLIMAPIIGVGGIVMAVSQDISLSRVLVVAVPVLFVVVGLVMSRLLPAYTVLQQRTDRINTLLREQLTGVRVIRAFVRQDNERERFDDANSKFRRTMLSIGWLWAILFPSSQIVVGLSSVAVVYLGGGRIEAGQMDVGALTAYISYLMMILFSVMMFGMMAMIMPRGEVSAKRIDEVLQRKSSIATPPSPAKLGNEPITFELDGVGLRYPGAEAPVLANISLTVAPGRTVGIIGSTGSGKSSIIRLFPRIIDATEGEVRAGGIPVKDLDPADLRRRIALIPQKAFLFSGTIASSVSGNVSSDAPFDEDRVRQALDAAGALEFVDKLADGIFARVEDAGKNFSGGQRQRLTIARAIYRVLPDGNGNRQANLLLFDDSFSALDYATDARLRARLPQYIGDTAVVIVAARVSTIRYADEIVVLDSGRIVGRGTHNELYATNRVYQEIVESQMSAQEAA